MKRFAVLAAAALLLTGCAAETPPTASEKIEKYYAANTTAALPTRAPFPVVAFIGDSYSAGSGSSDPTMRWTTKTAFRLDLVEKNHAVAGSGYVNVGKPGTCGKQRVVCPNYAGVVKEVMIDKPDIVVISGGRNDVWYTPEEIESNVTGLVKALRAGLPKAKIVITSPLWDARPASPEFTMVRDTVKQAAAAAKVPYADLGNPLRSKPDLIGPDGVHPNNMGYEAITAAATNALKESLRL